MRQPYEETAEWDQWLCAIRMPDGLCSGDMTIQQMDNVLVVVDDLEAAKADGTSQLVLKSLLLLRARILLTA